MGSEMAMGGSACGKGAKNLGNVRCGSLKMAKRLLPMLLLLAVLLSPLGSTLYVSAAGETENLALGKPVSSGWGDNVTSWGELQDTSFVTDGKVGANITQGDTSSIEYVTNRNNQIPNQGDVDKDVYTIDLEESSEISKLVYYGHAQRLFEGASGGETPSDDVNHAPKATADADSVFENRNEYNADKLIDGDLNTDWAPNAQAEDATVTLTWAQDISVSELRIYNRHPESNMPSKVRYSLLNEEGGVLAEGDMQPMTYPEPNVVQFEEELTGVRQMKLVVTPNANKGSGLAEVEVLGSPSTAPEIKTPGEWAIYQRRADSTADIPVTVAFEAGQTVRMQLIGTEGEVLADWRAMTEDADAPGTYRATLENVPAGGWYQLKVEGTHEEGTKETAQLARVGVGEIFVTYGQSNSCNCGSEKKPYDAEEDTVSSFDARTGKFGPCKDPQPSLSPQAYNYGSVWPWVGDKLTRALGVPVGFVTAGYSGASVADLESQHYVYLQNAIQALREYGFRAVLWHQGETDTLNGTSKEQYQATLQSIIDKSRVDAGFAAPWIVSEASYCWGETSNEVVSAQKAICDNKTVFSGPATDKLGNEYRNDNLHFNDKGMAVFSDMWVESIIHMLDVFNKSDLQKLYDENKDRINDNYTDASWKAFQDALKAAKDVLDDPSATQEDADAAQDALEKTIAGLKQKPSVPDEPDERPSVPGNGGSKPEAPVEELPFTDVTQDDWFYGDVEFVYEHNYMEGTSDTTFAPNASLTRGMVVTILYRTEGEPAASGSNTFADVAGGQWYTEAVEWAAANGIVNGYANGNFGPNDNITREQFAAILFRYTDYKGGDTAAKADLNGFTDASSASSYAVPALEWAVGSGIITGSDGKLLPTGTTTRAQAAAMFHRFMQD